MITSIVNWSSFSYGSGFFAMPREPNSQLRKRKATETAHPSYVLVFIP